jgi:hypothetical protein
VALVPPCDPVVRPPVVSCTPALVAELPGAAPLPAVAVVPPALELDPVEPRMGPPSSVVLVEQLVAIANTSKTVMGTAKARWTRMFGSPRLECRIGTLQRLMLFGDGFDHGEIEFAPSAHS